MNYRLQDIMKLIIPGLYFMALVFAWLIFDNKITSGDIKGVKERISFRQWIFFDESENITVLYVRGHITHLS